ncbi:hypothetical protein [Frigoribacterium sp. VKM Ac-2836]|uniref:hypothetical protein n=1 Tax=Frigoribacterium sp. VKM Ac-2836 TaxID=2739014 RepID=UPI001565D290|nr:hypothetical protein [Frigoribacterium sp. VKM Ac-2836]NRD27166.1 hypothetical protein [Frigoribacterium sp. VKM Ac-2836]
MELLFVVLGGAILGFVFHYALPEADTRGVLLAPASGATVAAIVWEALTWAGWPADGGWIWVVALVLPAVVAIVVCRVAAVRRRASDSEQFARLVRSTS